MAKKAAVVVVILLLVFDGIALRAIIVDGSNPYMEQVIIMSMFVFGLIVFEWTRKTN